MRPGAARAWPALGLLVAAPACAHVSGTVTSTATPLGTWTFQPTHCYASRIPYTLNLSSSADPLRGVSVSASVLPGTASTPSILAPPKPSFTISIQDLTANDGAPLVFSSERCRVFGLELVGISSTSVDDVVVSNDYSGTLRLDCPYPDEAHRFAASLSFTCTGDY